MLQNFKKHGRRQNDFGNFTLTSALDEISSLVSDNSSSPETIYTTYTDRFATDTYTTTYTRGGTPVVELNIPGSTARPSSAITSFGRPVFTGSLASASGTTILMGGFSRTVSVSSATSSTPADNGDSFSSGSGSTSRRKGGFGTGAKAGIAIGIVVILALIGALLAWRKKRKGKQAQTEDGAGGGQSTSAVPGMAEVDGQNNQLPPAYQSPEKHYAKEAVTTSPSAIATPETAHLSAVSPISPGAHELNSNQYNSTRPEAHELNSTQHSHTGVASATGGVAARNNEPQRQELSGVGLPPSHTELPSTPAQTYAPAIDRKPVSPRPMSESTSPPPWDYNSQQEGRYATEMSSSPAISGAHITSCPPVPPISANDNDTRAIEEEMARIKAQKERLYQLHALEEREEELRRQMEARKNAGSTM